MNAEVIIPQAPTNAPELSLGPIEEFPISENERGLEGTQARGFTAWAPPLTWGPWQQIAAHGGPVAYSISYDVIGDTAVSGAVNYYAAGGWVTFVFNGSIDIQTGDAWAAVQVCFFGNPLGSSINGWVNP